MGMRDWFSPRAPEPASRPSPGMLLPPEVVATVQAARIHDAAREDADGNPIIYVQAASLGRFRWTDLDKAADRIAEAFPELTPVQCFRAAQLIETAVGDAALLRMQRKAPQRSWVWDW